MYQRGSPLTLDERLALPRRVTLLSPLAAAQRYPKLRGGFTFHLAPPAARLIRVISRTESRDPKRRIGDLRRAQHADATLKNLLGVVGAKLDLCSSLPVFEYEADTEGYPECAAAFHDLAEAERRSCTEVLEQLRAMLERRAAKEETS